MKEQQRHEIAYQLMLDEEEARLTASSRYDYANKVVLLCAMAEQRFAEMYSRTMFDIKYLNPDVIDHRDLVVAGIDIYTHETDPVTGASLPEKTEFVDIAELLLNPMP